ncbi:PAS domain S-box protein [Aliikangiella maris]|uniref:histidine kinase n=2 Tax=Aliikangiella maris TaxID=3162458 RepID=A0ABV2BWT9_9GAMM
MQHPNLPKDEKQRIEALHSLSILDTLPDKRFDRFTLLAKQIFNVDIALISLVDIDRQWFKSKQGLDVEQTGRDISFCGHTILNDTIFYVSDASQDERFADNPLVTDKPNIRFYAGVPLHTAQNYRIGTLCIIDSKARELTPNEMATLENLANCVEHEINQLEFLEQKESLKQNQQLTNAIATAQSEFITKTSRRSAFESLLENLLDLTHSEYGFIGEVLYDTVNSPYLKTYAITNIAWNDEYKAMYEEGIEEGLEFTNLDSLFGHVMKTHEAIIANNPKDDPRGCGIPEGHPDLNAFLGVPVMHGERMVAMIGLANRPGGYSEQQIDFLSPFLSTIAQLLQAARLQQKNHESERRLRAIIEATNIGTWEWNVQTGDTVFNERWAEIVGYTLEELAPVNIETWMSLAHPDDLKDLDKVLNQHFDGELDFYEFQCRMKHKAGHWVWVHDRGQVYTWTRDNKPLLMYGTHADITHAKNAEMLLKESRKELQSFFDLSLNFLCIANTLGYFEKVNTTFIKALGYDEQELLSVPFIEFVHPDDIDKTFNKIKNLAKGIPTTSFVNRYRCHDNHYITLLWNCAPDVTTGKVYATAVDITNQKIHEQALRDQAEHTLAILNNMVDGLITIDEHGIIDSVNPTSEKIFGYTIQEMQGQNIKMLMPSPHRENHDDYLKNYQNGGIPKVIGFNREVEGRRKNGTLFPVELAVSEITRSGKPMYVGLLRDISERKRIDKMKTEFVSIVSHELRTPLTSISGALGLVNGGALGEVPEGIKNILTIAQNNSLRLTYLINDLLDMEKLVAGKMHFDMQHFLLKALLENAVEANQPYGAKKNISLVISPTVPDVLISVDNNRFMQILSNLLSNAVKFSPQNNLVTIDAMQISNRVKITVSDNGPGIPKEFYPRIFKKFAQADSSDSRKKDGTGLGLAITKALVERMNGSIGFESTEGKGTSFYFVLPTLQTNKQISGNQEVSSNQINILVIEDNPDVAELLSYILIDHHYHVDVVYSGESALEAIKHKSYDLITIDLFLPGLSGEQVIGQIRKNASTKVTPIIIITAHYENIHNIISQHNKLISWISKPIDQFQLIKKVKHLLDTASKPSLRILHIEDDTAFHLVIKQMAGSDYTLRHAEDLKTAKLLINQEIFDIVLVDAELAESGNHLIIEQLKSAQHVPEIILLSAKEVPVELSKQVDSVLLRSKISPLEIKAILKKHTILKQNKEKLHE